MACFHPLLAYRSHGSVVCVGAPTTARLQMLEGRETFELPCGKCIGCRQVRVRAWALRCLHESRMHEASSFITLTYDDAHVPLSLDYAHFQKFMRRLRKKLGPTRFFMCGEYGETTFRPHFHALLFGRSFSDRQRIGDDLFRSPTLESLWQFGFSSVGDVTYQSAAYVASYALKKLSGDAAGKRYSRVDQCTGEVVYVEPEFGRMSLKPGIGYSWFEKYYRDVFMARDGVVMNGKVVPAPRYYMDKLEDIDPDMHLDRVMSRYVNRGKFSDDCTPDRLLTREICAVSNFKRKRSSVL